MKTRINICFIFITLLFLASSANADINAKTFSITPFVGGYLFEGNEDLKTRPVSGIRFGYDFTKNWGLEGLFEYVPTIYFRKPVIESTARIYGYRLEALYNFMPEQKLVPYLAVGIGGRSLRYKDLPFDRNHADIDYGFGLKYFLYRNMAIRGDIRHIYLPNDNYNNLEYTIGLSYYFGGPKISAPVESVIPDSDNDGVADNLDQCPNTPAGVSVDKDGCPIDSDRDGVSDYLDKCPGTPIGVIVDPDGCPLDTDRDGVPDYLDKCPGTSKGVKVDKAGCPIDSDKDGVPDYLDQCPGTPAGVKVELDGCPPIVERQIEPQAAKKPAVVVQEQKAAPESSKETAVVKEQKASPAVSAEVAAVAKQIIERGRATINIEFDTGKWNIKPKYHAELKKFADVLKSYPDLKVVIEGHTDNVGGKTYNQRLSEKRAMSIRAYLIKTFRIAESRLSAKGYGMSKPIDTNKTVKGRQKNRRVEAAIDYTVKK